MILIFKNVVILITCVIKDGHKEALEEALFDE